MNRKIKTEWIRRLRSGEYKQGTGMLKYVTQAAETKYCCLGLLCEMAEEAGVVTSHNLTADGPGLSEVVSHAVVFAYHASDKSESRLPTGVIRWAGLPEEDEELKGVVIVHSLEDRATTLAYANDKGYNFDEIADIIEREL